MARPDRVLGGELIKHEQNRAGVRAWLGEPKDDDAERICHRDRSRPGIARPTRIGRPLLAIDADAFNHGGVREQIREILSSGPMSIHAKQLPPTPQQGS
jgi:hypothetical protein